MLKPGPIKQACAIPFRVAAGRLELCLVTSIRAGRWSFPKGDIDPGETAGRAA
jgi:8-oxo-dGTP pyrophosphatase MutT (NUDIX family)